MLTCLHVIDWVMSDCDRPDQRVCLRLTTGRRFDEISRLEYRRMAAAAACRAILSIASHTVSMNQSHLLTPAVNHTANYSPQSLTNTVPYNFIVLVYFTPVRMP